MKKILISFAALTLLLVTGVVFFILGSTYNSKTSNDVPQVQSPLTNSEIISLIKPATVYIETEGGTGSGMIFESSGYILTNAHVVSDTDTAKVKIADGQLYSATVLGRDEIIDIAVLKISGENFPTVTFGDSDTLLQGDDVFTLGYPFGLEGDVSFKEGTISRRITEGDITYLETSAQIHPGNSGGPLANVNGEVVGINSAGFGDSIEGIFIGETIKFALPINHVKGLINDLKQGREILVEKKEEKAPEVQKPTTQSPTPTPSLVQRAIELTQNPAHLFSSNFNPNTVDVYGVSIGDSLNSIPASLSPQVFGDWVHTNKNVSYRVSNSKVVEIRFSKDGVASYFGIQNESQVLTKFGQPDAIVENNEIFGQDYIYSDMGVIVHVHPVLIFINIIGI